MLMRLLLSVLISSEGPLLLRSWTFRLMSQPDLSFLYSQSIVILHSAEVHGKGLQGEM